MLPVRRAVGVAALLLLALAPAASAIPSDPPVTPQTPADGAVVPTSQNGIGVTFACPNYNQAEPATIDNVTYTFPGSAADYFVEFARSPALAANGRLADVVDLDVGTVEAEAQCAAIMKSDDAVPGVEITPGTYYWQVVRNLSSCLGCTPRYETGPVRSFTSRNEVALTVDPRTAVFSGYAHRFAIGAKGVPDGVDVVLERRTPQAWTAIGRATARGGKATAIAKLPRGRQQVRVAYELGGQRSSGAARAVRVKDGRKARRQTRTLAGSWRGRADGAPDGEEASFRVTKGGREIRGLVLPVLLGCPNPGPTGGTILLRTPGVIRISRIPIAPDGRFATVRTDSQGVAEVAGRLRKGRLSEGSAGLVRGECTITGGWSGTRR